MQKLSQSSTLKPKILGASAIALLLTIAVLYCDKSSQDALIFNYSQFDFSVFCPIADPSQLQGLGSLSSNYIT